MITFPSLVSVLPAFPAGSAVNEHHSLILLSANPPPTFKEKLSSPMSLFQNSWKQEEIVIPGKRSATRNPGFKAILDSGFRRNDGVSDFCKKLP